MYKSKKNPVSIKVVISRELLCRKNDDMNLIEVINITINNINKDNEKKNFNPFKKVVL